MLRLLLKRPKGEKLVPRQLGKGPSGIRRGLLHGAEAPDEFFARPVQRLLRVGVQPDRSADRREQHVAKLLLRVLPCFHGTAQLRRLFV